MHAVKVRSQGQEARGVLQNKLPSEGRIGTGSGRKASGCRLLSELVFPFYNSDLKDTLWFFNLLFFSMI